MINYYDDIIQGSTTWLAVRCGVLTASEMKHILTPTLKVAYNDKTRQHAYELLAQRITQYVEPHYIGDDMLRGMADEITARDLYATHNEPVKEMGFITNNKWGFLLGFSPDGLVGNDGFIEIKSRRQKYQIETILAHDVPAEYMLQIQTGLLVSERKWCDFISYSAGLPMYTTRVFADETMQAAIIAAATEFETKLKGLQSEYLCSLEADNIRLIPTERIEEADGDILLG